MTTLILSPFFFPEPISTGKYNTVLAQALVSRGEDVVVFASHPIYPTWRPEFSAARLSNVDVIRGGAWLRYPKSSILRRVVLEIWYAVFACIQYLRLSVKPRYVVPIFPPSFFFLILSLLVGKNNLVIGIVHDLQGVYAKKSAPFVRWFLQPSIRWVESRCFARCHRLIFLSQSMAVLAIQEYGLKPDHCVVCYPFVALPSVQSNCESALADVLPSLKTNVVYSGALGDKQNPEALFNFMNALGQLNKSLSCHIFSAGQQFERLRTNFKGKQNCSVVFHDLVPSEQVEELYFRSAIQIIPQAVATADGSLPSKLPNLLAAGVPIFAICDPKSELGYLVKKANAGVVAGTWQTVELLSLFESFLSTITVETRSTRRDRLHAFVQENFNVQKVVDEILCAQ